MKSTARNVSFFDFAMTSPRLGYNSVGGLLPHPRQMSRRVAL